MTALLINFTDGIRDASPNNLNITATSVSISPGQFNEGGDFTSGTIVTPPISLPADFTLELWIASGNSGILWDMSVIHTCPVPSCPVPCGIARPVNGIRFIQLNKGTAERII